MTLDVKLNKSATIALFGLIDTALRSVEMKDLQEQPHHYVVAANLMEVRQKLAPRADDYLIFHDKSEWTLKFTRAEALAFDIWFNPTDWGEEEVVSINGNLVIPKSYEYGLLIEICSQIVQRYYTH